VTLITTHLFVGLSNGHVYQFNLALLEKGVIIPSEGLNEYLSLRTTPTAPLIDIHVIDLKGKSQTALTEELLPPTATTEEEASSATTKKAALTKEISKHSTDTIAEEELSPKPSSIASSSASSGVSSTTTPNVTSKRMAAIGKAEYRYQENPHLVVCISSKSINVYLSGYNVKLFSKEIAKDIKIVRGEIIEAHSGSVCVCLLLSTGKLAFYGLPNLELMLEMNLPGHCLLDRLQEASISRDGRIVFWTGKYEMEQYSFIPKPDR
jgi:hypothetical protein